jgi:subtilisin family serine protease
MEGTASTGGTVGSPNMVNEFVFYEATPSQIDLQLGTNARKTVGGGFTTEQLNAWGFIAGQRIPARVPGCDADIVDAIAEGVIMVGAAGNGLWKHDVPGGLDWDNTFEMASRYPASVANPYYYMRGTSPTANDVTIPNICVGAIDVTSGDQKSDYSDCGPGVDIWAPGTSIISSYLSGVSDSRNSSYQLGKISGTSMASPNVCGVLACALEQNPRWNQVQAKAYIMGIAKQGQINASTGGPADIRDLQGAPNLYLYYKKERPTEGQTIPKLSQGVRPTSGMAWPRTRIFRFG